MKSGFVLKLFKQINTQLLISYSDVHMNKQGANLKKTPYSTQYLLTSFTTSPGVSFSVDAHHICLE